MENVTIIIAAYNAERTIARAICSVLSEPEATRIIIVDDFSTDRTVEMARSCDDGTNRLKIFIQESNKGPAAARNLALNECSSSWVTVLDADDFFLPGRLKGLLNYARDADFIADDMFQVSEDDVLGPRRQLLGKSVSFPINVDFRDFVLSNVTQKKRERAELGFIKPLMRRAFLEQHNLSYAENMRLGEDYELYARALGLGARMIILPAQGYVSVVRPNSLSSNHTIHDLLQLRECDKILLRDLDLSVADKAALKAHYVSVNKRLQWRELIEAVKNRSPLAALKTFLHHPSVTCFLLENLWEQFHLRFMLKSGRH